MLFEELFDVLNRAVVVFAKTTRKVLGRSTLIDAFEEVFEVSVAGALLSFSSRYGVEKNYRLPSAVKTDYDESIIVASQAFANSLFGDELSQEWISAIKSYLASTVVSAELSKLLEPGVEEFEVAVLADEFFNCVPIEFSQSVSHENVKKAWLDFQKAFSFASRARPRLREFIRASYEEGSFNALTDIKDVVDRMDRDGNNLLEEEERLSKLMSAYKDDLIASREWAKNFSKSKEKQH